MTREGLALRRSWPFAGEVARNLLGVLAVIAVAVAWGAPGAALAAGGGAAIAGAAASQDGQRGRAPLVVGVSFGVGAAVLIGAVTAGHTVVFVAVAVVWCLGAGLLWALGTTAGLVAAAASVLLVTSAETPVSFEHAAGLSALAIAGGLAQAVLIEIWPQRRGHPRARETVRSQLTWGSPVLRHAIRLATAVGLGVALARFRDVPQGYWIPLTVLMVLRPELAHTYTRAAERVVGIVVGVTVATTVAAIWHPAGYVAAILAVLCLGVAYATSALGYLAVSGGVAAAIVFMIDISGTATRAMMADRLTAIVIGGALAIWMYVVLPDRALVRLQERAGESLRALANYAAAEVQAFVHQSGDITEERSSARHRALKERSAFDATVEGTRVTSGRIATWLMACREAITALAVAIAALETQLPRDVEHDIDRLTEAADDYSTALRGGVNPALLTAACDRLRAEASQVLPEEAARVFATQVEIITKQVLAIDRLCGVGHSA
jgi:uncharacterized membrane protein YccC